LYRRKDGTNGNYYERQLLTETRKVIGEHAGEEHGSSNHGERLQKKWV